MGSHHAALLFVCLLSSFRNASAATSTLVVDSKSNIFAAGRAAAFDGSLPPSIRLGVSPGTAISFGSITGSWTCVSGQASVGPEGGSICGGSTNITSYKGISGIIDTKRGMFLVGVFLDDTEPADPAPARLDFTGNEGFATLTPQLRQTFFIGDGLTGSGSGTAQKFVVPAGATRLFLGIADGYNFTGSPGYYGDNSGSVTVTYDFGAAATAPACGGTTLTVDARANIFASGRATLPSFAGGAGVMPPCYRLPGGAGQVLTINSASGLTEFYGYTPNVGPRGGSGGENINSYKGISGIRHDTRRQFLTGVFVSDTEPADPAPARLDFTGNDDFTTLSPLLNQTFLIGDGRTSAGAVQQFNVPSGATKIYFGFPDAGSFHGDPGYYDDNKGSLTVSFSIGTGGASGGASSDVTLKVDGGTFTRNLGFDAPVAQAYFVNRLTPPSYPATLQNVQVYFGNRSNGLRVNAPISIVSAASTGSGTTLTGVTLSRTPATVNTLGSFYTYPVSPLTIMSGDFLVGFQVDNPTPGIYPADIDVATASQQRSYYSTTGTTFTLNDSVGMWGNLAIRAGVTVASGGGGTAGCTYSINPASLVTDYESVAGAIFVTAGAGCSWTATSNVEWIRITAGNFGQGNGTVNYRAEANPNTVARTGTITIAGKTYTLTQGAFVPCTYTINPTGKSFPVEGGTGTVTVECRSDCTWRATSNVSWVTITFSANTAGGSVYYQVARNETATARTGTMTIAGETFTVTQAAGTGSGTVPAGSRTLTVPGTANIFAAGRATAFSGTPPPSVSFAAGSASVLTFSSVTGTANCTSSATATPDGSTACASATDISSYRGISGIQASQGMFLVGVFLDDSEPQDPAPARLDFRGKDNFTTLAPLLRQTFFVGDGLSGTGSGTTQQFTVPSGATRLYLGFADAWGFGGAPGYYDDNSGGYTAVFSLGGGSGASCSYSISPASAAVPAAGATGSVTVTASSGCAWTASSNVSWITIGTGATGSGSGTAGYTAAANTTASPRSGTVTIAGQTFTVTQSGTGASCSYSVSPASAAAPAAGATATVTVTTASGCAWTASSNASWLTVSSGEAGSGSGTVSYTVAANTSPSPRSGTLTIAGQTFTVTQAAAGNAPVIDSIVNIGDFTAGFAPGMIVVISGQGLAAGSKQVETGALPSSIDGVSVEVIDGARTLTAPLVAISPERIMAQLPYGLSSAAVRVRVRSSGSLSAEYEISIAARYPRVLTGNGTGTGAAMAYHAGGGMVSSAAPALPGEELVLYLVGLGEVSPAIAAGQPGGDGSSASPRNAVPARVIVMVNGAAVTAVQAALAPGMAGVYAVVFQVPGDTPLMEAPILVLVGDQRSQSGATLNCNLAWQSVGDSLVGPAGGTVTAGDFSLTVPAGALAGTATVAVNRSESGMDTGIDRLGPVFGIDGLPDQITAAMTVTINLAAPPDVPEETYIILQQPGDAVGALFLKATVEGTRVTATIPPRRAPAAASLRATSKRPEASGAVPKNVTVYVGSLGLYKSPSNDFWLLFSRKSGLEPVMPRVANALDGFVPMLDGFGFGGAWKAVEKPVLIHMSRSDGQHIESPSEWWGGLRYSLDDGWSSSYISQKYAVEVDLALASAVDVTSFAGLNTPKSAHLLMHLLQEAWYPRTFDEAATGDRPWMWMDEATATAAEWLFGGMPTQIKWLYTPKFFLVNHGLEFPATTRNRHEVLEHGWGSSYLFLYLSNAKQIGNVYSARAGHSYSPVQALRTILPPGIEIADLLVDFSKDHVRGLGPEALVAAAAIKFSGTAASVAAYDSQDLSARFHTVDLPPKWPDGTPSDAKLSVKASLAGGTTPFILVYQKAGGDWKLLGEGAGAVELPNAANYDVGAPPMLIMVINRNAVAPFQSIKKMTLTVAPSLPAVACTFRIAPTEVSLAAGGGTGSVTVTAPDGCGWAATSNAGWISVTSGATGSGNGTVKYSIEANNSALPRTGTLDIAGQTFTVKQAGATAAVPVWVKDLAKVRVSVWNIPWVCLSSGKVTGREQPCVSTIDQPSWSFSSAWYTALPGWQRLVWDGLNFSVDATYEMPGDSRTSIRVLISGSLSADLKMVQTLRLQQTLTASWSSGPHVRKVDITLQQIPVTAFSEGNAEFIVAKAAYDAGPRNYVTNAAATLTMTAGDAASWVAAPDWSRFDPAFSTYNPIEVRFMK